MARRVIFKPEVHQKFLDYTTAEIKTAIKEAYEADGDVAIDASIDRLIELAKQRDGIRRNMTIDATGPSTKGKSSSSKSSTKKAAAPRKRGARGAGAAGVAAAESGGPKVSTVA